MKPRYLLPNIYKNRPGSKISRYANEVIVNKSWFIVFDCASPNGSNMNGC